MHVKVHLGGTYISALSYYSGATYVHTGQLFFNDSMSDLVGQQSPYSTHSGSRLLNSGDDIYASGGSYTLMDVQYMNSASGISSGLITTVTLGVSSTASTSKTASTTKSASTTKAASTTKSSSTTTRKVTTTTPRQSNQNGSGGGGNRQPPNRD